MHSSSVDESPVFEILRVTVLCLRSDSCKKCSLHHIYYTHSAKVLYNDLFQNGLNSVTLTQRLLQQLLLF
jgi:hypothetical protein